MNDSFGFASDPVPEYIKDMNAKYVAVMTDPDATDEIRDRATHLYLTDPRRLEPCECTCRSCNPTWHQLADQLTPEDRLGIKVIRLLEEWDKAGFDTTAIRARVDEVGAVQFVREYLDRLALLESLEYLEEE